MATTSFKKDLPRFTATRNACKLCSPLGASVVFRGIKGAMPILHGSQGCATYIRRYMISHFKEPIDIASSNFAEETTIFGGGENLKTAITNLLRQYTPSLMGIATTCLSETIGDNVRMIADEYVKENPDMAVPPLVSVSTPSYSGTHMDGFYAAVRGVVDQVAEGGEVIRDIALLPGFVSPADLRYLREVIKEYGHDCIMLPDYSETLDGSMWSEYHRIAEGGTSVADIKKLGRTFVAIELSHVLQEKDSAGKLLRERFSVPHFTIGLPIGVSLSDQFYNLLSDITGKALPARFGEERGRLIDSYADGHKYVFGKKAIVYGEEDFVISMASFLFEIGMVPTLCASGGESGVMRRQIAKLAKQYGYGVTIREGVDFEDIHTEARGVSADVMIGNSKGYAVAKRIGLPLIRVGFPIHDRFGGARIQHLGYQGTQQLFDRLVNCMMEIKQNSSPVGYSYI